MPHVATAATGDQRLRLGQIVTDDERIAELLHAWEEQYDNGHDLSADDLCRDDPHLSERVADRIEELKAVHWMRKTPASHSLGEFTAGESRGCAGNVLGNRYRLDRIHDEGGSGEVWRGFDLELLRTVAVKLPRSRRAVTRPDCDPFLREARRAARLSHPGIVPVYDVGRQGDDYFIVSEFVDGESLAKRLRREPQGVLQAVRTVRDISAALSYAHDQGFIHRDLKPANILVDSSGRYRLTDFGIAVAEGDVLDGPVEAAGTLPYMAPEQLSGCPTTDMRCDQYSLGVVFFELLTGRLPFECATAEELRRAILTKSPPLPQALNPDVPPDVGRACLRCLETRADDRFETISELATALQTCLDRHERLTISAREYDAYAEMRGDWGDVSHFGSYFEWYLGRAAALVGIGILLKVLGSLPTLALVVGILAAAAGIKKLQRGR